jgi:very-short-patch-repair endonuclease
MQHTTPTARLLRRNSTDAERTLWQRLRDRQFNGAKFRRQHPLGKYTVDFVCLEAGLVVEVDGGQHVESGADRGRDRWLQDSGYRVLRFWNNDVLAHTDSVLETILQALNTPHPTSPSRGEE